MSDLYRVLLVESDPDAMEVLENHIRKQFPCIDLHSAATQDAAIDLLERNRYEIVICDAFLRSDRKISFVGELCKEGGFLLIVVTGDTEISAASFSPHLKEGCIHHVLYKPLDFEAFARTLQCAILRLKARKVETA